MFLRGMKRFPSVNTGDKNWRIPLYLEDELSFTGGTFLGDNVLPNHCVRGIRVTLEYSQGYYKKNLLVSLACRFRLIVNSQRSQPLERAVPSRNSLLGMAPDKISCHISASFCYYKNERKTLRGPFRDKKGSRCELSRYQVVSICEQRSIVQELKKSSWSRQWAVVCWWLTSGRLHSS